MKKEAVAKIISSSVLFKKLGPSQIEALAEICTVQYLKSGETIFSQGEMPSQFYMVGIGEVGLVLAQRNGAEMLVGRVGPGGHFGETSLLTGKPHALNTRAISDVALICISLRFFHSALLNDKVIYHQLSLSLAERLRVSFQDQADTAEMAVEKGMLGRKVENFLHLPNRDHSSEEKLSMVARRTDQVVEKFSANIDPVLLTGDTGTGKKFLAKQIHQQSGLADGPYIELDLRDVSDDQREEKFFGARDEDHPYARARRAGVLEQFSHGTVVLGHAEMLSDKLQRELLSAIQHGRFRRPGSNQEILLSARLIFICGTRIEDLEEDNVFLPEFLAELKKQHYRVPCLHEHKRDLPLLIEGFIKRYSKEYGKEVPSIPSDTMGLLMNYDWPGNLPELDTVIQRAVMLSHDNEIFADQIVLGLPKSEGKWEFNLLRIPGLKKFLKSDVFPVVPRFIVGLILLFTILTLLFGPREAEKNIGSTISWAVGWPLLYFSFFFLARTWCSVCTLAVPGKLAQALVKPERSIPPFIKKYSGWIMASLCIVVLWVELVWNAYQSPLLTAAIILAVSAGSFFFSILYKRRAWCRYLCPLGAINAIFSMPSVLELRANKHFCLNRCREHVCFRGDESQMGCPMFRHPFLVDNNRDCIMCSECIKNCNHDSILLNLRLTPEELWDLNTPRRADTFLVVSLGAIFFPFALHEKYGDFILRIKEMLGGVFLDLPSYVPETIFFFALIGLFQLGYVIMVRIVGHNAKVDAKLLSPMLAYGFIPLILGCYLAEHFGVFIEHSWRIWPNMLELFGVHANYEPHRLVSMDATTVLQTLTVAGGMIASFYAIFRIMARFKGPHAFSSESLVLPYCFMLFLGGLSLYLI